MSERSSFVSGTVRLLLMLAVGVWLLFLIGSGDSEQQSREQAEAFDLDEQGLVRSLHVSSETFDEELLPQLSSLRKLTIADRQVDGALARRIADTPVRSLTLESCELLPDAVAVLIADLPELTELSLAGSDGGAELSELLTVPCRLLNLSGCRWVKDEHVENIAKWQPELEYLNLEGTGISGRAVSSLAALKRLIELNLSNCDVQDQNLPSMFSTLSKLQTLNVCGTHIPLQQLRSISDAKPELQLQFAPSLYPDLAGVRPRIDIKPESDDGVRLFAGCFSEAVVHAEDADIRYDGLRWLPAVRSIRFRGAAVTDRSVVFVEQMPQLRSLDFAGTSITDATLQRIAGLVDLRNLNVSETDVTEDGMVLLKKLPNLVDVSLAHTPLTDSGLQQLTADLDLKFMDLSGTHVSAAGLQWLTDLPHPPRIVWTGLQITKMSESLARRLHPRTDTFEVSGNGDLNELLHPGLHFRGVRIQGAVLTDAQIDVLSTWPDLSSLMLINCRFESESLDLSSLSSLFHLQLADCGLTDDSLKSILLPPGVGNLDLSRNSIRDFDLSQLGEGPPAHVKLSETNASIRSVRRLLASGPSRVDIRGVDFDEVGAEIVPIPDTIRIPELTFSFNESSVELLSHLGVLPLVSMLEVYVDDGTEITQSIVAPLVSSRRLFSVTIHGSRQACAELQKAMQMAGYSEDCRCVTD